MIERRQYGLIFSTSMGPAEAKELQHLFIDLFREQMSEVGVAIEPGTLKFGYSPADPYGWELDDGTVVPSSPQVGVQCWGYESPYRPEWGYY